MRAAGWICWQFEMRMNVLGRVFAKKGKRFELGIEDDFDVRRRDHLEAIWEYLREINLRIFREMRAPLKWTHSNQLRWFIINRFARERVSAPNNPFDWYFSGNSEMAVDFRPPNIFSFRRLTEISMMDRFQSPFDVLGRIDTNRIRPGNPLPLPAAYRSISKWYRMICDACLETMIW